MSSAVNYRWLNSRFHLCDSPESVETTGMLQEYIYHVNFDCVAKVHKNNNNALSVSTDFVWCIEAKAHSWSDIMTYTIRFTQLTLRRTPVLVKILIGEVTSC